MTAIIHNPVERTRFIKFTLVGFIGAIVDFGVFNLLSTFLHVNAILASVISFCMAIMSNFIWHRYWTYADSRSKPLHQQIGQFVTVHVIGLVIRTPIFAFLEFVLIAQFQTMHFSIYSLDATILGHNLALAVAVGVVMLWNFFANRYWTYNDIDR